MIISCWKHFVHFQALHNILLPLSPDDPKSTELQRELNPTLLDQLIRSNFDSNILLPRVTIDTVRQLKDIISDTLNSATNFLEGQAGRSYTFQVVISLFYGIISVTHVVIKSVLRYNLCDSGSH